MKKYAYIRRKSYKNKGVYEQELQLSDKTNPQYKHCDICVQKFKITDVNNI